MNRLRVLTAIVTATCCAIPATRATGQRARFDSTVHRLRLENGLQVIVAENHRIPLATILVAVRNGAMTQDSGDQGLAHLYEHLLFRSYKDDPDAFAAEASDLDAESNGTTGEEVVTYYLALPSKNAIKGISLLARLLQTPRFSDHDLRKERPVVLDELQRDESDPEQALDRQASRMLWGTSWSRKDVGGDSASLEGITLTRLRESYARYYVPNNTALIVTGDVSPDDAFGAAYTQFGPWARAPDPFLQQPLPPLEQMTTSSALLMARPLIDATILVKFRGPSAGQDTIGSYAVDLLCAVLNEQTSPFQQHLTGSGLFQSVQCDYETLAHIGPITFRGETTPGQASAALMALLHELDGLDSLAGVTDEDITIARKRQRVTSALDVESSYALAPALASWWSMGEVIGSEHDDHRFATKVLNDLKDVAAMYVSGHPRIIAVLAPPEVIPSLEPSLRRAASAFERAP